MFYILGLFVILGLILGGFTGSLPFNLSDITDINQHAGNMLSSFKEKTFDFIFPASANKILIDNLNSNYDLLDRFFSDSPASILNSKDIPEKDKEILKQAAEAFDKTKSQVQILGEEAVKNEPGIFETTIKKILGLSPENNDAYEPGPTHIPPNCNLVCGE